VKHLKKYFTENKYVLPFIFVIFNFLLKVLYLDYGDIGGDEPFTIFNSQIDFTSFINLLKTENNPPLYFILLHYWIKFFGISAFSVRFLPLIFSCLTVFFIFRLAIKFFNLKVALITSILFSFSNYHIYFSHETRVYSLFALLTVISMFYFLSMLKDKNNKAYFLFLLTTNSLLIYSHFFGFFVILIQLVAVFGITELRNIILKKYIFLSILTAILYIPYLKILITRFYSSKNGTWITSPKIEELYNILWKFTNAPVNTVFILILFFIFLTLLTINRKIVLCSNSKIIFMWFIFPYFLMYLISLKLPIFIDRYLVFISIGYYFSIALVLNSLNQFSSKIANISSILVSIMMLMTCKPKTSIETKNKEIVQRIIELKKNKSLILICPPWNDLTFVYYYNQKYFKDYKSTKFNLRKENIFPINNSDEIKDTLLTKNSTVIFLDYNSELVDKHHSIYNKLANHFKKIELVESNKELRIFHFKRQLSQ
jgi:mannosyltransferase